MSNFQGSSRNKNLQYPRSIIETEDDFDNKTKACFCMNIISKATNQYIKDKDVKLAKTTANQMLNDIKNKFGKNAPFIKYIEGYLKFPPKEWIHVSSLYNESFTTDQLIGIKSNLGLYDFKAFLNVDKKVFDDVAAQSKKWAIQNLKNTINTNYAAINPLYNRISDVVRQMTDLDKDPLRLYFKFTPFLDIKSKTLEQYDLGLSNYQEDYNTATISISRAIDPQTLHHEATHLFFRIKDKAIKNGIFNPKNDDDVLVMFVNAVLRFFGLPNLNDKNITKVLKDINKVIQDPFPMVFNKHQIDVVKELFPGLPKVQNHVMESLKRYRNPGYKLYALQGILVDFYQKHTPVPRNVQASDAYQFINDFSRHDNESVLTFSNCAEDLYKIASTINYKFVQDFYKGSGYIDEEWICRSMEVLSIPKRKIISNVNIKLLQTLYAATNKLARYTAKSMDMPYYSTVHKKQETGMSPNMSYACIVLFFILSSFKCFAFFGDDTYKLGRPKMKEQYSKNFYAGVSLGYAPFARGGGLSNFELSTTSRDSMINYAGGSDKLENLRNTTLDDNYYVAISFGYKPRYSNFRQEIEFSNPSFFSKANLVSDANPITFTETGDGVSNLYFIQNHYRAVYHAFYHIDSEKTGMEYFFGFGGGVDMARMSFSDLGSTAEADVRIANVENGVFVKDGWGYGFVFEALGGVIHDISDTVAMEVKGRVSVSTQDVNKTRASTAGDLITLWFAGVELGFLLKL